MLNTPAHRGMYRRWLGTVAVCMLALLIGATPQTAPTADSRALLNAFAAAPDIDAKLVLLPRITAALRDEELPQDVRYHLALSLLQPQLTWHAGWITPPPDHERLQKLQELRKRARDDDSAWTEAHPGEEWMRRGREVEMPPRPDSKSRPVDARREAGPVYWRLRDPSHADVARATRLLEGVKEGELGHRARSWVAELRRNNTVLTFDVAGGFTSREPVRVLLDARAAANVSFRLYRLREAEHLLAAAQRIGTDFIYRDHGLSHDAPDRAEALMKMQEQAMMSVSRRKQLPLPDMKQLQRCAEWTADLSELPVASVRDSHDDDDWIDDDGADEEAAHFGDFCEQFSERLQKHYQPDVGEQSSWQCNRIVELPADAVKERGAYLLVAEANGVAPAVAPIVVDPLGLTLRRCRDGVFAMTTSADGQDPVAGARIIASEMLGICVTDTQGAGFARVFAAGDVPIVAAAKDGRFAVGGFGRVFEGVYVARWELAMRLSEQVARQMPMRGMSKQDAGVAQVYADRYVVAAYTDRPTYRPGQQVQFKLIVRTLRKTDADAVAKDDGAARPEDFRRDDFDFASNLVLPGIGSEAKYEVLNAKGRPIAEGVLQLNDYGTAAGAVTLSSEEALGPCTMRVSIGGEKRLVPEVFAVQEYRRPNFELSMEAKEIVGGPGNNPEVAPKESDGVLRVSLTGRYYFGKPVAGGKVDVRLVRADHYKSLSSAEATLDAAGMATVDLQIPPGLSPGSYAVLASLTDDSGRTVSRSVPYERKGDAKPNAAGVASLPRFVAVGRELEIPTTAKELIVWNESLEQEQRIRPRGGVATVRLAAPGWHQIAEDDRIARVFVHGGDAPPSLGPAAKAGDKAANRPARRAAHRSLSGEPQWVDLTNYAGENLEDEDAADAFAAWQPRAPRLLALFDRQHVRVGESLRVLVYAPGERPRILLTIEGRTVVDYFIAEPRSLGPYHVIEVPIRERHLPNFYLQGRLLTLAATKDAAVNQENMREELQELQEMADGPEGEDPRWCRIDVIDPNAGRTGEKLKVEVTPDRAEYRPGEEVTVAIRVSDLAGKPREAEVSLAAVDESVFTFGEDRSPLIARSFADARPDRLYIRKTWRSSIGRPQPKVVAMIALAQVQAMQKLAEQMQKAMQAAKAEAALHNLQPQPERAVPLAALDGAKPVTSIPLAAIRKDFRETATWQPQIRTDAAGVATARFRLPDSLTSYRLTAIGLTKETHLGSATANIRATKPLAVQVFLPRFAVEGDRLQLAALVHNNTNADFAGDVAWAIEGFRVDPEQPEWRIERQGGATSVHGAVKVPAGGSTRVSLWAVAEKVTSARVTMSANDDKAALADAEQRDIPIRPLGRAAEHAYSGVIDPATGRARVQLPAGFVAEDLRVTLSRTNVAEVLDGLGYLVEYPNGCVEQTMSRFLPAVIVANIAGQGAPLPPDVKSKLPEVLSRGLTRLYNFQHADGGWGWWEKDATNDGMTVYVVDGLARCKAAGVAVDESVLSNGCAYLRRRIEEGKLAANVEAEAWLALARAGQANRAALAARSRTDRTDLAPHQRAQLALACRRALADEQAAVLWGSLREWQPEDTLGLSLLLSCQIEFGAPVQACNRTADALLARRQGHRWDSTRTTAWAIESLSELLRTLPGKTAARAIRMRVAGKETFDAKGDEALRQIVHRLRLSGDSLSREEGIAIDVEADADEPVRYTITAVGTQRLDRFEPTGTAIRMSREYLDTAGQPFGAAPKAGEVIQVRVQLDLQQPQEYVMLEDFRPSGCEFADDRLRGRAAEQSANTEFRDDRVCAFFTHLPAGRHEFTYYLRAETAGAMHVLPGRAYPMYAEQTRGETGSAVIEVK